MLIAKKTLKFKKHINVISEEKLEIALFPINVFFLKMGISKKTWMFFLKFFPVIQVCAMFRAREGHKYGSWKLPVNSTLL